ncbi:hypothetical protein BMS3Abin03_03096 [bacterium BMS3Abin03]|nr:hypothetical protein BMS3Abin03_03096 [bacterium BMS3Abin03]
MISENLKTMINEYFDNELDKKSESSLFVLLSQDDEAREYFKNLSFLETVVDETSEEPDDDFEERILRSVEKLSNPHLPFFQRIRIIPKLSYAFAILMLVLTTYFFVKLETYQDRIDTISNHLIQQAYTIETLYNSLPAVEVNAKSNNPIIVRSNL